MGDILEPSFVISCKGMVSLPGDTILPLSVATCKVVYKEPAAGCDRIVPDRTDRGPDGFAAGVLLLTLRVLPS